jgi:hypothetical protein
MKSLFLKIFLSFWVALALFRGAGYPGHAGISAQRNSTWDALRTTAFNEAIGEFTSMAATQQAHDYLDNLQHTQHVRAYYFDEQGNEISGRSSQGWAEHVAAGKPLPPRPGMIFPRPQILTESRASAMDAIATRS